MLRDLQPMMTAMRVAGVDPKPLLANDTAHLVAYGQDVVSLHEIPGINLTAARVDGEIRVNLIVRKWVDVEQPVHLCLGLFEPTGEQKVRLAVWLEPNTRAPFIAHCLQRIAGGCCATLSRPLLYSLQRRLRRCCVTSSR